MSPVGMPVDGLRKFTSKHGIPRCRHMKKLNLCQAIVVAKHDIVVANGTAKVTDPRTSLPTHFATLRFLNVLFGEEIWPLLANRGK
eukprot:8620491-Ditylum_brightwellii.AAC.1